MVAGQTLAEQGGRMSTAVKKVNEPITASMLYALQNKLMHQAFSRIGMPYHDHKDTWLDTIQGLIKRDIESLSDMNLGERSTILSHLMMKGSKVYSPHVPRHWTAWTKGDPEPTGTISKRPMHVPREKYAMVKKIHAILADMKLPWSYVDQIARERFKVEFVEWLESPDLHKVVQMMVIHQKRNGGPKR